MASPATLESLLTWVGEEPLSFALVIDTSSSLRRGDQLTGVSSYLAQQVPRYLRDGKDDLRLVVFDSAIEVVDVTGTDSEMESKIKQAIVPGGGTALHDAIFYTSRDLAKRPPGRRVILVATDGVDNQSSVTRQEASEEAIRNGVTVFAFALGSIGDGHSVLEDITTSTGGRSWITDSTRNLETAWKEMRQLLAAQYNLRFITTKPVNKRETVKLQIQRPELSLYFPRAVFAPKAPKKKK